MSEFFLTWAANAATMQVILTLALPCLYGFWKLIDWVDDLTSGRSWPTFFVVSIAWSAFIGFLLALSALYGE